MRGTHEAPVQFLAAEPRPWSNAFLVIATGIAKARLWLGETLIRRAWRRFVGAEFGIVVCAALLAAARPLAATTPGSLPSAQREPLSAVVPLLKAAAEARFVEPASDDAAPPEPYAPLTPLTEEEAARLLASALEEVVGVVPSEGTIAILWAHWAHETGRGRRMVGHNFGGVKGESSNGGTSIWTRETTPTGKELVRRRFRVYESAEFGALDYVQLLAQRYASAFRAAREGRVADFAQSLGTRGYYTEDMHTYRRAVTRLARECGERRLARRVVRSRRDERLKE